MNIERLFYWLEKRNGIKYLGIAFCLISAGLSAQEFRNIKCYEKETGTAILKEGTWLKKDRRRNKTAWITANAFNLSSEKGFEKYQTIGQIRDFYAWFDAERIQQGRHFKSAGIAGIAARQLSKVDNGLICFFIVRNSELKRFVNDGSKQVFEFAFPLMRERYFSKDILSKSEAVIWDINNGKHEQCEVLRSLYQNLSTKAFHRLEKMAKGKGIFKFGVPKRLRFQGDLSNCEHRFRHGATVLLREYDGR
ncbi:MAG: hypothetical protein COB81_06580 [Flavobacteriaceae bacterium]|nr:MAG: hypothetical protein COB81_06580 [Flavobacteriaceae bacterium]